MFKIDNNSSANIERRSYDYPSLKYVSQFNVSNTQLLPGRLRLLGCYNLYIFRRNIDIKTDNWQYISSLYLLGFAIFAISCYPIFLECASNNRIFQKLKLESIFSFRQT